jgi:hypothetical protein
LTSGRVATFANDREINDAVMTKSPKGDEIVILSRDEYDRLIAAHEDRTDAKTARRVIAQIASGAEAVLSESELGEFLKKTPLSFWRKKRRMTQADLAKEALFPRSNPAKSRERRPRSRKLPRH